MATRPKARKVRTAIKNYGLMWRRDAVSWGEPGHRGALYGFRSGHVVDFRHQIGVYVLYDESRRSVYVGQAGGRARLFQRLRHHRIDRLADRWQYFSWFGLLTVTKRGNLSKRGAPTKAVRGTLKSTLNEIEGVLIAATEPPFNKQGARFRGIHRYRQKPIEQVSLEVVLARLSEMDKKIDKALA
jgi:hypothetical protein